MSDAATQAVKSYKQQFEQLFDGSPWLDETFEKKLAGVSEHDLFESPHPEVHSAAQVVSHVVEWRKEVIRRLEENVSDRQLTMKSPENWKSTDELKAMGWNALYDDLKKVQHRIVALLKEKSDSYLRQKQGASTFDNEYFIAGLLQHDAYHLGQIGLILKMVRLEKEPGPAIIG